MMIVSDNLGLFDRRFQVQGKIIFGIDVIIDATVRNYKLTKYSD